MGSPEPLSMEWGLYQETPVAFLTLSSLTPRSLFVCPGLLLIQPLRLDSNCASSIQMFPPQTYGMFSTDFISTFII